MLHALSLAAAALLATGVPVRAEEVASCPPTLVRVEAVRVGRRFELQRDLCFQTKRFGRVVLTRGYRSDGSSSPIRDSPASRAAGFLHDAFYAASGHLRFLDGVPARWTKAEADDAYCAQMERRGVAGWHRRANCAGARRLPQIGAAWDRLAPKRERRWAQWATRPPAR